MLRAARRLGALVLPRGARARTPAAGGIQPTLGLTEPTPAQGAVSGSCASGAPDGGAVGRLKRMWRAARRMRLPAGLGQGAAGDSIWLMGRLYWVDAVRHFGLIDAEDGRIVYFHGDAVAGACLEEFAAGDTVLFDEKVDRLGRLARSVRLISATGTVRTPSDLADDFDDRLPIPWSGAPSTEALAAERSPVADRSRSVA